MASPVLLTEDATCDLNEIWDYLARHHSKAAADRVLGRFEDVFRKLALFPNRCSHPKELLSVGIRDYREILFKPYRIIYRVIAGAVYVHLIADGRRDMQALLTRRLLGP